MFLELLLTRRWAGPSGSRRVGPASVDEPGGSPSLQGRIVATRPEPAQPRRTSPAGLGDAGELALVRDVAQADPAQPELAVDRAGTPAPLAAGVGLDRELRLAGLLDPECCLRHLFFFSSLLRRSGRGSPGRAAGPGPARRSWPSSRR